jgi:hypothetical protein
MSFGSLVASPKSTASQSAPGCVAMKDQKYAYRSHLSGLDGANNDLLGADAQLGRMKVCHIKVCTREVMECLPDELFRNDGSGGTKCRWKASTARSRFLLVLEVSPPPFPLVLIAVRLDEVIQRAVTVVFHVKPELGPLEVENSDTPYRRHGSTPIAYQNPYQRSLARHTRPAIRVVEIIRLVLHLFDGDDLKRGNHLSAISCGKALSNHSR